MVSELVPVAGGCTLMAWCPMQDAQLIATATELFQRGNPNDLLYMVLVLLNACVTPVASAAETPKDLGVILCMVKNCRKEVVGCVQDPECKAALDCLESCGLNDQVRWHLEPDVRADRN